MVILVVAHHRIVFQQSWSAASGLLPVSPKIGAMMAESRGLR